MTATIQSTAPPGPVPPILLHHQVCPFLEWRHLCPWTQLWVLANLDHHEVWVRLEPDNEDGIPGPKWSTCEACSAFALCPVAFNLRALARPD